LWVVFDVSHSDWMIWNLNVVLICISLMAKNVELKMILHSLAICIFSFETCLFISFVHLLIRLVDIFELNLNSLYFWALIFYQKNSWIIVSPNLSLVVLKFRVLC
jgi:hypothetical protein